MQKLIASALAGLGATLFVECSSTWSYDRQGQPRPWQARARGFSAHAVDGAALGLLLTAGSED
jgi:hypothetical protein